MHPTIRAVVADRASHRGGRQIYQPSTSEVDQDMMRHSICLATEAAEHGEYPYGAVIARKDVIVAEATNRVVRDGDVTRHAEMVAISEAQKVLGSTSLDDCTIYSNAEPCALCSYAIRESRISRVVYGLSSPIMGGVSRWNILTDQQLSGTMPEVFAPPPRVLHNFLCEEADGALRRASPLMWAFIRSQNIFAIRPHERETLDSRRRIVEPLMRFLRTELFDRFGRGRT
jgi:tRNA(adenine34) deaminase